MDVIGEINYCGSKINKCNILFSLCTVHTCCLVARYILPHGGR